MRKPPHGTALLSPCQGGKAWKAGEEGSGCLCSQGTGLLLAHMVLLWDGLKPPLPKALLVESYHTDMFEPVLPASCRTASVTTIQIPMVHGAPTAPLGSVQPAPRPWQAWLGRALSLRPGYQREGRKISPCPVCWVICGDGLA